MSTVETAVDHMVDRMAELEAERGVLFAACQKARQLIKGGLLVPQGAPDYTTLLWTIDGVLLDAQDKADALTKERWQYHGTPEDDAALESLANAVGPDCLTDEGKLLYAAVQRRKAAGLERNGEAKR